MTTTTMTIRLDGKLKEQLDQLATSTHRSKSNLAAEALRDYIELNAWQIQQVEEAIKEADSGDFASDQDVERVKKAWGFRSVARRKFGLGAGAHG